MNLHFLEGRQAAYPLIAPTAYWFAEQVAEDSPWVWRLHSPNWQEKLVKGTSHPDII